MAVAKARLIRPLPEQTVAVDPRAVVIGGGISGMTAALSIAEQGFECFLVERSSDLGGNLNRVRFLLDGDDPADLLRKTKAKVLSSALIHVFTGAEVEEVSGYIGHFTTTLRIGERRETLKHGVIVMATGGEPYKPKQYLYGQSGQVITQLELEALLKETRSSRTQVRDKSPRGTRSEEMPNPECIVLNHDFRVPSSEFPVRNVVMIQCVGSRGEDLAYCSKLCCGQAVKNALQVLEHNPSANVTVLFRDMRTYGFMEDAYTLARDKRGELRALRKGLPPRVTEEAGKGPDRVPGQASGGKGQPSTRPHGAERGRRARRGGRAGPNPQGASSRTTGSSWRRTRN